MATFVGAIAVALCGSLWWRIHTEDSQAVIRASRNFYGVLKVIRYVHAETGEYFLSLQHGTTTHGIQLAAPDRALTATSYYAATSGLGLAFKHLLPAGPRHIGVLGLGVGTVAAFARKGDRVRYYEIDRAVEELARDSFSFLARSAGQVDVLLGDARLTMERELTAGEPQRFDLLVLDAFSSDSPPAHLLTREAFRVYLGHMNPDGIIAVNISNIYVDLQPVVDDIANHFKLGIATIWDDCGECWYCYGSMWVLLAQNANVLKKDAVIAAQEEPSTNQRPPITWRDDSVNLFAVLK
jgi:spermidine synthase